MKEKINKFIHSKNFIIILILLLISLVGIVGTYAWFTWSSTENTSLTLTIGKLADVTFDNGNDINITNLAPVFNYTDGEKTTFSINNKDTTGTTISYSVELNITTIASELVSSSLKYKLMSNGAEIGSGDFSSASSGKSLTIGRGTLSSGITDFDFYIYIDGNIENDPNMMNKTLIGTITVTAEEKNVANTIFNLYSPNTTVTNNSITYNYDTTNKLMQDTQGNIRYYGASPNNYIYFNCETYPETNCELWRIIGVVDGKLKLIRNESLSTNYSWDTSASTVNDGYGINEWSEADLMKLLNPGYESNTDLNNSGTSITVNNSLYYNSGSGTCYSGRSNSTKSCDFTSTGLKNDTTRNMIEDSTYYLGGGSNSDIYSNASLTMERGTNVVIPGTTCSGTYCNDTVTRTTSWTGKIGLMYPSDYGYATDFTKCSQTLYNYDSSTDSYACRSNDWLYNSASQWLLTPGSSRAYHSWSVGSPGFVSNGGDVCGALGVRPVLHLDSVLVIESGSGTKSDPYRISA